MSNPSGRKGAAWETDVAKYLAEEFPGVERRVKNGVLDRGDITGIPYPGSAGIFRCRARGATWI